MPALPIQDDAQAAKVVDEPAAKVVEEQDARAIEELAVEYSPIAMRMMKKMGYKDGSGLGKAENGIREPIVARRCAMGIGFNQIDDN